MPSSSKRHHIVACFNEKVRIATLLNWWGAAGREGLEVKGQIFSFFIKEKADAQQVKNDCYKFLLKAKRI